MVGRQLLNVFSIFFTNYNIGLHAEFSKNKLSSLFIFHSVLFFKTIPFLYILHFKLLVTFCQGFFLQNWNWGFFNIMLNDVDKQFNCSEIWFFNKSE